MRKVVYIILSVVTVYACGNQKADNGLNEPKTGEELFKTHCAICHGSDGNKGFAGARKLPESELDLEARIQLITQGKGTMMPYREVLSQEEIKRVAEYTLSLK
jgi:cytochrome c6